MGDEDGIVFSTPVIPFDVRQHGAVAARVWLSFETSQPPPPSLKANRMDQCWCDSTVCGALHQSGTRFKVATTSESESADVMSVPSMMAAMSRSFKGEIDSSPNSKLQLWWSSGGYRSSSPSKETGYEFKH